MCPVVEYCVLWWNDVSFGGMMCTLEEWGILGGNGVYCVGIMCTVVKLCVLWWNGVYYGEGMCSLMDCCEIMCTVVEWSVLW